jgi:tetratricopeptide (TPR) repeat protein
MPETDPASIRAATTEVAKCLVRGDLAAAEQAAMMAMHICGGRDSEALHMMGLVRLHQRRLDEARTFFTRALQTGARTPELLLHTGRTLSLQQQHAQAAPLLQEAVAARPEMGEAWFELGNQQHMLQQLAEAENSYRRVLALDAQHGAARLALGAVLMDLGRPGDAEIILAPAMDETHAPRLAAGIAYNLALAQMQQSKADAALKSITISQGLDPGNKTADAIRFELLRDLERFDDALAVMDRMLAADPHNLAYHQHYNILLYQLKRDADFLKSYDRAPRTPALQRAKGIFLLTAERGEEAHAHFQDMLRRDPQDRDALASLADALNLLQRPGEATALLEQALQERPDDIRLLSGIADSALLERDPQKAAAAAQKIIAMLPYDQLSLARLGTAWRMLGDARDEALTGYETLIQTFDLEPPDGFSSMADFNAELTQVLGHLHPPTREFIGQSLRGGTQTKGNLFGAGHALVEALRRRIEECVARYIAGLDDDATHPFTGRRTKSFAFAGSWSSRLADCGFHVNHVHPMGWISSCYYVDVPDAVADQQAKQGWIKFGEPSYDVGLSFRRAIQPAPGRLVLFPSYMWHGTIPFHGPSPRTTIAFDVAPK